MDLITLQKTSHFKDLVNRSNNIDKEVPFYDISGVSSDNEYVPLFAPLINLGIYEGKIVHYSVPKKVSFTIKIYSGLFRALVMQSTLVRFRTSAMKFTMFGMKGLLFEKGNDNNINILFLLTVKTEYMKQMFQDGLLDLSKFRIFISREFYSSVKYRTIYNRINKDIILPHLSRGVELVVTNNVAKECFNNNVKKPKFKTLTEMKEYLEAFNNEI